MKNFFINFFFKQKTAYEISLGLVGSEMCIRDRLMTVTVLLTRYAVPVSVLCTTALPELVMVAVVTLAVGAVVSASEPV